MISGELDLPPKCRKCPAILQLCLVLQEVQDQKEMLIDQAVNDDPGILVDEANEMLGLLGGPTLSEEAVERRKQGFRQDLGRLLDEQDENIEATVTMAQVMTHGCIGTLTLRAVQGNRSYAVTICRSPGTDVFLGQSENIEPVNVKRDITD